MDTKAAYEKARFDLAFALMEAGAVLTAESNHPLVVERQGPQGPERGFKLKLHEKNPDAPLSPFFLNLRTPDNPKPGPLTDEIVGLAARCMRRVQIAKKLRFNATAGVPRAGDPFAKKLAHYTGTACVLLEKYEHDGKRSVAALKGKVPEWIRKVAVVDDLVTKADSKLEAIQVLRDQSLEVSDVIVLVDREQGGGKELSEWNCSLHSVFTITELLDLYLESGKISRPLWTRAQEYLALNN